MRYFGGSAIRADGGIVSLFGILDGFGNGQEVRTVVNPGAKVDVVTREVVGINRAQTRIIPSVYPRKPAIRKCNERAFGSELSDLWEFSYLTQSKRAFLLDNLLKASATLRIPLARVVLHTGRACATA